MKSTVIRTVLFFITLSAGAIPDAAVFTSISVDPATGQVTITWQPSPTPNIKQYEFYEIIQGIDGGVPFVTLPRTETTYTFSSAANVSRRFYLVARDSANVASDETPMHNSIATMLQFDSCNNHIILSWTPYIGWPGGVLQYKVYDYNSGTIIGSTTSTSYVIQNIQANTSYSYYIKAESGTSASSTSYRISKYTAMPATPSFIIGTASVEGANINTEFSIDPSSELSSYILYRSLSITRDFDAIHTFSNYNGKLIQYSDPDLNTTSTTYYYKLAALNTCNVEIKTSGPVNNIILNVSNESLTNHLSWTKYKPFSSDLRYTVIQVNEAIQKKIIENTSSLQYTDDVSPLRSYTGEKRIENEFCYFITVRDTLSESKSNRICVSVMPDIKAPNGFTPNGDGKNDIFKPLLSFKPEKYLLVVYNRWGNKLFQSTDPETGWDGRYKGVPVETGVYIYSLMVTSTDGRETTQSGEITVVYP